VFQTLNDGATWTEVDHGTTWGGSVTGIAVDPLFWGNVYLTTDAGFGHSGHVWRSLDSGATWQEITGNLPPVSISALAIDHSAGVQDPTLFVGNGAGVYASYQQGPSTSWSPFGIGLPNAPVSDLQFNPTTRTLAVSIYGRGVWETQFPRVGLFQPGAVSLGGQDFLQIAQGHDQDGRLQVFAVAGNHGVYVNTQTAANSSTWTGWTPLGGWVSAIAVGEDPWGRTEVFAVGANTGLWVNSQTSANSSTWAGWASLGGGALQQIVVGNNADGRLDVFTIGGDHGVYHQWQDWSGHWSGFQPLGGWVSSLTVGRDAAGRLQVFGIGANAGLWVTVQNADNATTFGNWSFLGGSAFRQIQVAQNADGRLEVFALRTDNSLWHQWQTTAGTWSGWWSLGGAWQSLTVGREADGRLEVYAIDFNGQVSRIGQTVANGGWGGWQALSLISEQLVVGANANGSLDLFSLSWDSAIWHLPNA
jgi:hypothetical protein